MESPDGERRVFPVCCISGADVGGLVESVEKQTYGDMLEKGRQDEGGRVEVEVGLGLRWCVFQVMAFHGEVEDLKTV